MQFDGVPSKMSSLKIVPPANADTIVDAADDDPSLRVNPKTNWGTPDIRAFIEEALDHVEYALQDDAPETALRCALANSRTELLALHRGLPHVQRQHVDVEAAFQTELFVSRKLEHLSEEILLAAMQLRAFSGLDVPRASRNATTDANRNELYAA